MITGFFIWLLIGLLAVLSGFLPDATALSPAVFGWIDFFKQGQQIIGVFLPMDTFFQVFGLVVVIEGALLSYKIVTTVYRWIRG